MPELAVLTFPRVLFETMPEYSHSYPTALTPGKMWRLHHATGEWFAALVAEHSRVLWFRVKVVDVPCDASLLRTDWYNTSKFVDARNVASSNSGDIDRCM